MTFRYCLSVFIVALAAQRGLGETINIPQSALLPSGDPGMVPWVAGDAGLNGPTTVKLIAEITGTAIANSFVLDVQNNGFPAPPAGGATDDVVVFGPADVPGAMATVDIPPGCGLALFHDVYDESGLFLSGPNGILNDNAQPGTDDAYLNSDTSKNYTDEGRRQLVKYYLVSPAHSYQFTSQWTTVTQLGSGFRAFIFLDDDHTPNYDYDDLIVGIVAPPCTVDADCTDGALCNGEETCEDGVCLAGEPVACDDGDPCTQQACVEGECQPGMPVDCSSSSTACSIASCDPTGEPGNCDTMIAVDDGTFCDDGNDCTGIDVCEAGMCHGVQFYGLDQWDNFANCMDGPAVTRSSSCVCFDLNSDGRIDLEDAGAFQTLMTAP